MPELLTVSQVAQMLGVSLRTASRFVNRDDFPAPYATLPSGRVWDRGKVERWARKPPIPIGRGRGRPKG
jgi:predicted DNA-binding transcriptional regulator AlpA